MKTKEEILKKVSSIIDVSNDEQVILNACHFLYSVIISEETQEKIQKEKEEARKKALETNKPLFEMMKNMLEG